jgi:hypothetical protein
MRPSSFAYTDPILQQIGSPEEKKNREEEKKKKKKRTRAPPPSPSTHPFNPPPTNSIVPKPQQYNPTNPHS